MALPHFTDCFRKMGLGVLRDISLKQARELARQ